MENTICNNCKLTIHPNYIGYHKCGYGNCPVCKEAIANHSYWHHIRSHPGHENDGQQQLTNTNTYGNRPMKNNWNNNKI